jgi:hypothetical protein
MKDEKGKSNYKKDTDVWLMSMRASPSSDRFGFGETDEELDQRMIPAPTSPVRSDSGWLLDDDSQESLGNDIRRTGHAGNRKHI